MIVNKFVAVYTFPKRFNKNVLHIVIGAHRHMIKVGDRNVIDNLPHSIWKFRIFLSHQTVVRLIHPCYCNLLLIANNLGNLKFQMFDWTIIPFIVNFYVKVEIVFGFINRNKNCSSFFVIGIQHIASVFVIELIHHILLQLLETSFQRQNFFDINQAQNIQIINIPKYLVVLINRGNVL